VSGWQDNLVQDPSGIAEIVRASKRIAVLGIKPESRADQPAFYVPEYLKHAGLSIVPVPVYYPDVQEILGERVYRRLEDIPGEVDLVEVFRRPQDIPPHLPDLLAKRPKAVWFQSGISHVEAAEALARAGIRVVQDRCLMVEHRRLR
jgi:predicted CoA-binding protein